MSIDYQKHILVIDDDDRIRKLLSRYLRDNGFCVTTSHSGLDAEKVMRYFLFDLLVVDIMMPEEDGITFTKKLRAAGSAVPVIMLTAMAEVEDRIAGLETGADDYLPKPFEPKELLLRINSVLKRTASSDIAGSLVLKLGEYDYHVDKSLLYRGEEIIHLAPAELQLLKIMAVFRGKMLTREELSEKTGTQSTPRAVDVQITRLRRKIEQDPKIPRYLQTIRGKGYMLLPD